MKLMTKEIENKLKQKPLYSTDGIPLSQKKVVVKYFNPCGRGTWYVFEGRKEDNGDWLFFGLVDLYERELGYFRLSELESVKLPYGLKIERDVNFNGCVESD